MLDRVSRHNMLLPAGDLSVTEPSLPRCVQVYSRASPAPARLLLSSRPGIRLIFRPGMRYNDTNDNVTSPIPMFITRRDISRDLRIRGDTILNIMM